MIRIALTVAAVMSLASHLGLLDEMSRMTSKIVSCPKCMTFWSCILLFLLSREDPAVALALSFAASYSSLWMSIPLKMLNDFYIAIWQRLKRKNRRKSGRK